MLIGPDNKLNCPYCKGIMYQRTLMSGNTIGQVLWSDGKRIAPMLPEIPKITKCVHCQQIFWIDDEIITTEEESDNPFDKFSSDDNLYAKFLELSDYLSILDTDKIRNSDQEKYIRLHIWWELNNRIRNNEKIKSYEDVFNQQEIQDYFDNINRLKNLLDLGIPFEKLTYAEILRNTYHFDEAKEIFSDINPKFEWIKDQILPEIEKSNPFVILLKT